MNSAIALRQAHADGIQPDALLTVSEWADAHRRLPKKSSAEPGPWRTSRTPYLREIMDCWSSASHVEEVVLMKAGQVGGSEAILNALGYAIDHSPGPAILVQPTEGMAKRFSKQRLEPLVTDTPRLAEKIPAARTRGSANTLLSKEFPGGQLIITGANSAAALRSMPAQYALLDEIDAYPVDVDEEGSPLELVEVRQRTFARKKRLKVSTPTIKGRSAIEDAWEASDQRRFHVPCPHCGEMQPLEFARLVWSKLGLTPEEAAYECRACGEFIQDHQKTEMLARGEWRPDQPERAGGRVRGYHLNALYAPVGWISWGDIARKFVRVHKHPEKFRVFVNTVLGETWRQQGEAPDWQRLYDRRETYTIGTAPKGVLFITAAADVQHDRILVEVVGWGRGKTSWSLDWLLLPGETSDINRGPWVELAQVLERTYPHASGGEMGIAVLAVDSGDQTQTVYSWARQYPLTRVIAVKGFAHGGMLLGAPTTVDVTIKGRKVEGGAKMWPVATNLAKSELYGWLRLTAPTDEERAAGAAEPNGYCHFPQHPEEYFKELTAEQLVVQKNRRGYITYAWEVIPGRQNHTLDVRIYARAAAQHAGLDRFKDRDWQLLEQRVEDLPKTSKAGAGDAPAIPTPVVKKPAWLPPKRPGGWLKGGR